MDQKEFDRLTDSAQYEWTSLQARLSTARARIEDDSRLLAEGKQLLLDYSAEVARMRAALEEISKLEDVECDVAPGIAQRALAKS